MDSPRMPQTTHASSSEKAVYTLVRFAEAAPRSSAGPPGRPTIPAHHELVGVSSAMDSVSPSPAASGTPSTSVGTPSGTTPAQDHDWYPWRHNTAGAEPPSAHPPCITTPSSSPSPVTVSLTRGPSAVRRS